MNKKDLRVVKTRTAIIESMIVLMKKKKFDQITINDISASAKINRSTFYYHFEDKFDLLYQILDIELNELGYGEELNYNDRNMKEDGYNGIINLINYLNANKAFYKAAFDIDGYPSFELYFRKRIKKSFLLWIKSLRTTDNSIISDDILAGFYSAAYSSITIDWLKNDTDVSPETLFSQLKIMTENNFFDCTTKPFNITNQ